MHLEHCDHPDSSLNRRGFLRTGGAVFSATLFARTAMASAAAENAQAAERKATDFQIACMTLPYSQFPLQRALEGIEAAGYRYVAWGTTHQEGGERVPVMPTDAPPERAAELGKRCRNAGLEPLMMFSTVYPEAANGLEVLTQRIRQASAGIGQVLTFGHTSGGNRAVWVERFKKLGPIGRTTA
ncbi:MAG: hypothetical protein KY476_07880 [Planctomycetes bacterium]|nr:hypothetical protein [Planctomycetota bacterium]